MSKIHNKDDFVDDYTKSLYFEEYKQTLRLSRALIVLRKGSMVVERVRD